MHHLFTRRASQRVVSASAFVLALASLSGCDSILSGRSEPREAVMFVRSWEIGSNNPPSQQSSDIFLIQADGTGERNLTQSPAHYAGLTLSPDRRRVAFGSDRQGGSTIDVWVMGSDGSNLANLGPGSGPRWSHDGAWIAFKVGAHVAVVRPDGTGRRELSLPLAGELGCAAGDGFSLAGWQPDGTVGFWRYVCGEGYRFYTVKVDGTGLARTDVDLLDRYWSPDHTRLLTGVREREPARVWNADGSGDHALVPPTQISKLPSLQSATTETDRTPWSPDSRQLAFLVIDSGCALYAADADGSGLRQLAPLCGHPSWSVDGTQLVLSMGAVHVVAADGSGARQLTPSAHKEYSAMWVAR